MRRLQAKMLDVLDGLVDGVSGSGAGTESLVEGLLGDPDFHSCMGVRPLILPTKQTRARLTED